MSRISELHEQLVASGIPVVTVRRIGDRIEVVHGVSVSERQRNLTSAIVGAQDWSATGDNLWASRERRKQARELLTSTDPVPMATRNTQRLVHQVFGSLIDKVNEIVVWASGQGADIDMLPLPRSWSQSMQAARQFIDRETNPEV